MVVDGASGKRAGAAEADDLDVDETLTCRCSHRCVVDAELCRGLWSVGVDDDVGVVEEALQDALAFGPQQIERDRTFAAIEVGEVGGHAAAPGPGAADLVTAQRLDLDDVRALVAEDHGREGPGHVLAEVDYAESREWTPIDRL